jgi:hypothetical protein
MEIKAPVFIIEEAGLSVVSPLYHVKRKAGDDDARATRHDRSTDHGLSR